MRAAEGPEGEDEGGSSRNVTPLLRERLRGEAVDRRAPPPGLRDTLAINTTNKKQLTIHRNTTIVRALKYTSALLYGHKKCSTSCMMGENMLIKLIASLVRGKMFRVPLNLLILLNQVRNHDHDFVRFIKTYGIKKLLSPVSF